MAIKCQKEKMRNIQSERRKKILEATDNGRCWWLYQMLIATPKRYGNSG